MRDGWYFSFVGKALGLDRPEVKSQLHHFLLCDLGPLISPP